MTQPFTWPVGEWGGGSNVFDVRSYGATPADVGIGVLGALQAAVASPGGGTIFIPALRGQAWTCKTNISFTAGTFGKNIRLLGEDGTVIQLALANTGGYVFRFVNNFNGAFRASNLIFVGKGDAATVDCAGVFSLGSDLVEVDQCAFFGVLGGTSGVGLVTLGGTHQNILRDSKFCACGSFQTQSGCVLLQGAGALVDECVFTDPGQLNGQVFSSVEGTSWIYCTTAGFVDVENTSLDEDQNGLIVLDCPSGQNISPILTVRSCNIAEANPGVGTNPASIKVIGTAGAAIVHLVDCLLGLAGPGRVLADISATTSLVIENLRMDNSGPGQATVNVRAGCGSIDAKNISNGPITFVTSGAGFAYPSTRLTVDGVDVPFRVNHAGSPYVLLPSQVSVLADVSGGAIALTVPQTTTVPDGRRMTLAVPTGDASLNNITLSRAGADTLQDPANIAAALGNSVTYATKGGSATWEACATEQQWRVVSKVA